MKELYYYYVKTYDYVDFSILENTKELIKKGKEYGVAFSDCMKIRKKLISYFKSN